MKKSRRKTVGLSQLIKLGNLQKAAPKIKKTNRTPTLTRRMDGGKKIKDLNY